MMTTSDISSKLFRAPGSKVVYILSPMSGAEPWLSRFAQHFGVNIAVISGMDWDNDLTPWPAPGQPPGDPAFQGLAPDFLKKLTAEIIPAIDKQLGIDTGKAERTLCGISLSGLFALWTRTQTTLFRNIISLSGSFWYSGFDEWMKTAPLPSPATGYIYISLGDKESQTKVVAFRSVATDTAAIVELLRQRGCNVVWRSEPGNHYADIQPRLLHAFEAVFTL